VPHLEPIHAHPQSRDTHEPITAHPGAHQQINRFVESSRTLPWLVLTSLLSGIALGLSMVTLIVYAQNYRELERENRLMQQKYDDMKVEFLSRGMNPHPHMPGESK
jgi:hypothetical protein